MLYAVFCILYSVCCMLYAICCTQVRHCRHTKAWSTLYELSTFHLKIIASEKRLTYFFLIQMFLSSIWGININILIIRNARLNLAFTKRSSNTMGTWFSHIDTTFLLRKFKQIEKKNKHFEKATSRGHVDGMKPCATDICLTDDLQTSYLLALGMEDPNVHRRLAEAQCDLISLDDKTHCNLMSITHYRRQKKALNVAIVVNVFDPVAGYFLPSLCRGVAQSRNTRNVHIHLLVPFEVYSHLSVWKGSKITVIIANQVTEQLCILRTSQCDVVIDISGQFNSKSLKLLDLLSRQMPQTTRLAWAGHPGTIGSRKLVYAKLTDELCEPNEEIVSQQYVERVVTMPPGFSFLCFSPSKEIKLALEERQQLELEQLRSGSWCSLSRLKRRSAVVGIFGVTRKVCESTLHFYMNLAKYVRIVWFGSGRIEKRLTDAGIKMIPHVHSLEDYFKQMAQVDLAVDTFPYNGTTTVFSLLFLGIPIVTLDTRHVATMDWHRSKTAASIIRHVGFAELEEKCLAKGWDDWFKKVIHLAKDLPTLSRWKLQIRTQFQRSCLFHTQAVDYADAFMKVVVSCHNKKHHDR